MNRRLLLLAALLLGLSGPALADPPVASYIFPAGGQRGTTVDVRIGGLNLLSKASLEVLGPGVEAPAEVRRGETVWFEGPLLPLPDSQQAEDYPKDYNARLLLAADAPLGPRPWRVWTSQGAAGTLPFIVGDLPEVVEREAAGDPVPQPVTLPLTINGRIFPREDVDLWSCSLKAGEAVTATVDAGRLGSPLDPWIEALDPDGRRLAEPTPAPSPAAACDARLAFVAPREGTYTIRIHDVNVRGGQAYVYRLTLTTGPSISRVFPLGGQRGTSGRFMAEGIALATDVEESSLPTAGAGCGPVLSSVQLAFGASARVELDDLPSLVETEPNDDQAQAPELALPGVGEGRIDRAGDADFWAVTLTQGRSYYVDLRAARLGSSLDGVISVSDAGGKELARAEGTVPREGDPELTFQPKASGRYLLRVTDRFHSRGGPGWAYRLRVTEATPDFRLGLAADTLTLPRGTNVKLKVEAQRLGGFAGPITLELEGLPEGTSVGTGTAVIAPKAATLDLTFKAEPTAPIRATLLTVRGRAEIDGKPVVRVAARRPPIAPPDGDPTRRPQGATVRPSVDLPEIDGIRVAVALPAPFVIKGPADFGWSPRGTVHHRHYVLERNGFTGPVQVRLADRQARHLQGVTGPVLNLAPDATEFDYAVALPPWMEIGRTSRSVIMASGTVREADGTEHEVSYSSTKADVQMVAVVAPGLLGLEPARSSVALAPGKGVALAVKVARGKGVAGPIAIALRAPECLGALAAEPLTLPDGEDEGILRIVCPPDIAAPRTVEVTLQAVTASTPDPVTAEAPLTIVVAAAPGDHD